MHDLHQQDFCLRFSSLLGEYIIKDDLMTVFLTSVWPRLVKYKLMAFFFVLFHLVGLCPDWLPVLQNNRGLFMLIDWFMNVRLYMWNCRFQGQTLVYNTSSGVPVSCYFVHPVSVTSFQNRPAADKLYYPFGFWLDNFHTHTQWGRCDSRVMVPVMGRLSSDPAYADIVTT